MQLVIRFLANVDAQPASLEFYAKDGAKTDTGPTASCRARAVKMGAATPRLELASVSQDGRVPCARRNAPRDHTASIAPNDARVKTELSAITFRAPADARLAFLVRSARNHAMSDSLERTALLDALA